MGWEVEQDTGYTPPPKVGAVYYLVLPTDNIVMNSINLNGSWAPSEYAGTFDQFIGTLLTGTPLIPLDTHHALLLEWVDIDRMARNRPYLDDAIKAAIALVA